MAKSKKKQKIAAEEDASNPVLEAARKAHDALPGILMAAEDTGQTEFEFFDGSVFQFTRGAWEINVDFKFYSDRWGSKADVTETLNKAWDVIAESRMHIQGVSPYFIRAVLGLRVHPSFGFQAWLNARNLRGWWEGQENMSPTIHPVGSGVSCNCAFVTAQGVMGFDPYVFVNTKPERAAAIIVHEALHIQRAHYEEHLVDSHQTNNILHDLEINDDLAAMGYELDNAWFPSAIGAPDFLHALDYLAYLPTPPPSPKGGGSEGEDGGSEEEDSGEGQGSGKRKVRLRCGPPSDPGCGSGAGGEKLDAEKDVPDGLKRSEGELEANRLGVAKDVASHSSQEPGSVPEGMLRWAQDKLKPPQVNWRNVLPTAVRNMCNRVRGYDRTDSRLSRATMNLLALTEDLTQHAISYATYKTRPKILVALDTSGSMSGPILDAALSELRGAIQSDRADVYFVSFDAATYAEPVRVNFDLREIKSKVLGGGGTDVMVVYDDPRVKRMNFDSVIVVTDGYTPIARSCPLRVNNLFIVLGGVNPFDFNKVRPWEKSRVIHIKE